MARARQRALVSPRRNALRRRHGFPSRIARPRPAPSAAGGARRTARRLHAEARRRAAARWRTAPGGKPRPPARGLGLSGPARARRESPRCPPRGIATTSPACVVVADDQRQLPDARRRHVERSKPRVARVAERDDQVPEALEHPQVQLVVDAREVGRMTLMRMAYGDLGKAAAGGFLMNCPRLLGRRPEAPVTVAKEGLAVRLEPPPPAPLVV